MFYGIAEKIINSPKLVCERPLQNNVDLVDERGLVETQERSLTKSVRRMSDRVRVLQVQVGRIFQIPQSLQDRQQTLLVYWVLLLESVKPEAPHENCIHLRGSVQQRPNH
jgi:hypothetical protein